MKELDLAQAVQALKNGQTVVYPTETFYALGCDALHPDAVAKIFLIKRRDKNLPLPVIIGAPEQLALVADLSPRHNGPAEEIACKTRLDLVKAFWPAALSIIFPARQELPVLLTGGTGRVAVRLTPHAGAAELCRSLGGPLVLSSANISGQPPSGKPEDLPQQLTHSVDGGFYNVAPAPSGALHSTLVEAVDGIDMALRIRRPGAVSSEQLQAQGFRIFI